MPKKYNIGKPSDMRRFQRDLEKMIVDKAADAVQRKTRDVICHHCQKTVTILPGQRVCPLCGQPLKLPVSFN